MGQAKSVCCAYRDCKREPLKTSKDGYCVFHAKTEDKDAKGFEEALRNYVEEIKAKGLDYDFSGFVLVANVDFLRDFGVTVLERARFNGAKFQGDISFEGAKFESVSRFGGAQFQRDVSFKGVEFRDDVSFVDAEFRGGVSFERAKLRGAAYFWRAKFRGSICFSASKFQGGTSFKDGEFQACPSFRRAEFERGVSFWGTRFQGGVSFAEVKFEGVTSFANARIQKGAYFWGAKFRERASFARVEFDGGTSFAETRIDEGAHFWEARFQGGVSFERAQLRGTSFEAAQFQGSTDSTKPKNRGIISFQETRVQAVTAFEGAEFRETGVWTSHFGEGEVSFMNAVLENVSLVSLHLGENAYINLKDARFTNTQIRRRDIEAHIMHEQQKAFHEAKGVYLLLKNNFHTIGRYDEESWAFRKEKDMERKSYFRAHHWLKWLGSTFCNILYGYGERLKFILGWCAGLIFFSSIWYWLYKGAGEAVGEQIVPLKGYLNYLYFSVVTFTTLGYGDFRPIGGCKILASIEALLGIFFVALFIFAIARRTAGR